MMHLWTSRSPRRFPQKEAATRSLIHRRGAVGKGSAALAAVVLGAVVWSAPAQGACFRYGEVVTLTGSYTNLAAPPADGLVRDPRNDAARLADLLVLDDPFCVDADVLSGTVLGATTIQLSCPAVNVADGASITLTGRIVGAHTGNGHTPVLLSCQS